MREPRHTAAISPGPPVRVLPTHRREPGRKEWQALVDAAWGVERNAVARNTSVGAAVLSAEGRIYTGCNVEHKLRCHDVHAELNALSSMVAAGDRLAVALLVVSLERRLTPCGGCMDWIFELGGPDCLVAWQGAPDAELVPHRASALMPLYPY